MKCPACACLERGHRADLAFLAGVAFAIQFNNDAIRRHVCDAHAETVTRAAAGSLAAIPEHERRTYTGDQDRPRR